MKVAWHEVPGIGKKQSRPVGHGMTDLFPHL
jgi:hypothetical protein